MHILIIPSELYNVECQPLAGIFQHQQAQVLKSKGFNVGVISAGFVPYKKNFFSYPYNLFEVDNGVNIYRLYKKTFIPGRITTKFLWKYLLRLHIQLFDKYIKEQGVPDIIHAHNCLFAGLSALAIKKIYNIPYIITEHNSAYKTGLFTKHEAIFTKAVLKNANKITVVSTELGKLLEKLFGEVASPNYPIFNIIDNMFEREDNVSKHPNNKKIFTFLSIGSLDINKNHIDLLKAFASKFKGNSKVKLKIGGDGNLKNYLKNKSYELGIIEQVTFMGLLSRDNVLYEMQNCDVFVLPSIVETFGVVLIEALSLGKPVIATRCGGPEDIVTPTNGILVPTKQINQLAEAMHYLYLNIDKFDPISIRKNCLLNFGQDAFVNRLQNIYKNVIKETTLNL